MQPLEPRLLFSATIGNLDGDFDVDDADFGIAFAAFSGPDGTTSNPAADLDFDGDVDDADFGLAFSAFTGPAEVFELTSGETKSGTVAAGNLVDTFTIDAQAGDDLLITLGDTDSGFNGYDVALYGPDNNFITEIANDEYVRLDRRELTQSGTYTIVVCDANNTFGNYNITAVVIDDAIDADNTVLNSGETATGTAGIGDIDTFTINAQAGDDLLITLGDTDSGFSGYDVALYGPDNNLIHEIENDEFVRIDRLELTQGGTYTIVVRNADDIFGNYNITAVVVDASVDADNIVLNSGETRAGTAGIGDIDTFTITAQVGDDLLITLGDTDSGFSGYDVALYGPDNNLINEIQNDEFVRLDRRELTQSGTYTIVVRNADDIFGNYNITAVVVDASVDADNIVLNSGETRAGTAGIGDIDTFTITAQVGDDLLITLGDTDSGFSGYDVALYGPDNNLINEIEDDEFVRIDRLELTQGGTYTIVVRNADDIFGNYNITAVVIDHATDADNIALNSGETRAGTVGTGDIDTFTITAQAGDDLLITLGDTDSGFNGYDVAIYGPDNNLIAEITNDEYVRFDRLELTQGGTYTIVVRDADDIFGNYNITAVVIDNATDADNIALNSGETRTGTVGIGDIDTFTIDAQAGEDLLISLNDTDSGFNGYDLALYGPDNNLVTEIKNVEFIQFDRLNLIQSGTYTLVVRDADDIFGNYNITAVVAAA